MQAFPYVEIDYRHRVCYITGIQVVLHHCQSMLHDWYTSCITPLPKYVT